jgi:hypothetical protein
MASISRERIRRGGGLPIDIGAAAFVQAPLSRRATDQAQHHERIARIFSLPNPERWPNPINDPSDVVTKMSDVPSRTEIAAQLQAAEARTETRIVQLSAALEARGVTADHKIDLLMGKIDVLSAVIMEVKADSKTTRSTIWVVGIGAVVAVLSLVAALWIAGINVQANMIAAFQAGLGVRPIVQEAEAPKSSPVTAAPQSAVRPGASSGK